MDLNKEDYRLVVSDILRKTGLPAIDPLRERPLPLVKAVVNYFDSYKKVVLPHSYSEIHDRI
jgi:hypothetical protein